jgi:hypothetical protein
MYVYFLVYFVYVHNIKMSYSVTSDLVIVGIVFDQLRIT